jgi:hypothetical protein
LRYSPIGHGDAVPIFFQLFVVASQHQFFCLICFSQKLCISAFINHLLKVAVLVGSLTNRSLLRSICLAWYHFGLGNGGSRPTRISFVYPFLVVHAVEPSVVGLFSRHILYRLRSLSAPSLGVGRSDNFRGLGSRRGFGARVTTVLIIRNSEDPSRKLGNEPWPQELGRSRPL